jgi:hypothetical protein
VGLVLYSTVLELRSAKKGRLPISACARFPKKENPKKCNILKKVKTASWRALCVVRAVCAVYRVCDQDCGGTEICNTLGKQYGFLAWALGDSLREIKKGGSCHTSAIWLAVGSTEIALDR